MGAATSLAVITATTMVVGGLKKSISVRGTCRGGRPCQWKLIDADKQPKMWRHDGNNKENGLASGAGVEARPRSIVGYDAVTIVPVWWPEDIPESIVATQSSRGANSKNSPKLRRKN